MRNHFAYHNHNYRDFFYRVVQPVAKFYKE